MVKISIIMPIFNGIEFLNYSIASIINQTLNDVEIICIDDGSTDGTWELLKNLENKYESIKIFSQENQGPAKARNIGLKHAQGEYVGFLDDDDAFLEQNALEIMYNFAKENNADIVSANLQFLEQNDCFRENWHYIKDEYAFCDSYGFILPDEYGIPYGFTKCLFNKDFLSKNNIMFPNYITGEDPYFLANAMVNTNKIYTVPIDLYGYHYSMGGGVNAKITTYEKKLSYVKHFFDTCNVLFEGGLKNCANEYKLHLLHYLTWRDNIFDEDLYKIFNELFEESDNYFDETFSEYIQFNIFCTLNNILKNDNDEYLFTAQNKLSKINYSQNDITSEKLRLILNSNTITQLKLRYIKDPIENWNELNEIIRNDFIKTNKEIELIDEFEAKNKIDLINNNRKLINKNKELINQNNNLMNEDEVNYELINQNRKIINQNREIINQNRKQINEFISNSNDLPNIILYDHGVNDNHNDIWNILNELHISREIHGTKLIFNNSNQNWQYLFLKDMENNNDIFGESQPLESPCIIEFDLIDQHDCRFDLLSDLGNQETPLMNVVGLGHWKIMINTVGIKIYLGNSLKLDYPNFKGSFVRFGFVCTENNSYLIFKNFKVYKI